MPRTVQQHWDAAEAAVQNPDLKRRILHSAFVHKHKKPHQAAKDLVSLGTNFLEIPMLGMLVDQAFSAVINKLRASSHRSKEAGYRGRLEKEVKFGIKTVSIEELDRYRSKVSQAVKDLKDSLATGYGDRPCDDLFEIAENYHYAEKRLEKLHARLLLIREDGQVDRVVREAGTAASGLRGPGQEPDRQSLQGELVPGSDDAPEVLAAEMPQEVAPAGAAAAVSGR
ncbi:MAG: hypothetical protein Fur0037_06060 [Planctomycetota bacterium]